MRGNGERIGPQNLPTSSIAGGIWNLLNQQRAQQRGAWPSATPAVVTDPYFMYVPLLLNTTSTNGQQNNTFLDSSSNAFTITRNGTPTQGSFTPYQPSGYWSGYFNGSTDYITAPNNTALDLDTGDFTIECWFYIAGNSANNPGGLATAQLISKYQDTSNYWALYLNGTSGNTGTGFTFEIVVGGAFTTSTYTGTISQNTWHHIAICRSGSGANNLSYFLDGTRVQQSTNTRNGANTGTLRIAYFGYSGGYNHYFNGYISNARILKGTSAYSGATYTVPTTPLTAITNTSLLTLQNNRFRDNSTNAFAITVNGTPKVQAFQPFSPAASYSAATYGGSGYFNGSSYLSNTTTGSTGFNLSTGAFTIETWVYLISTATSYVCLIAFQNTAGQPSGLFFGIDNSSRPYIGNGVVFGKSGSTAIAGGTWTHVAVVSDGTNIQFYTNGQANGSAQAFNPNAAQYFNMGASFALGNLGDPLNGYLSNFRVVKGTAVYTGNFTPPTLAPLTTAGSTSAASYPSTTNVNTSFAAANTSLLTNFTNAGIYDAAWQNNALTVGDAQASTTQYKWSPTSMKFDGTLDALSIPPSTSFGLGTGDWTIEFWLYLNSVPSANITLVSMLTSDTSIAPHIYYAAGGGVTYYTNSANRISGSALSATTWYYIALTKASGSTKLYINGTQSGATYTDTNNYGTSNPFAVADYKYPLSGLSPLLNGYVQDVRITKGVARTITTPTAAFPTR